MAVKAARGVTKQILLRNPCNVLQCRHRNVASHLYSMQLLGVSRPLWSSRAISQYPRSHSSHPRSRYKLEETEEDEYDVEEGDLETLRKSHRTAATAAHSSREGKRFSDFPLNARLCARLDELGYAEPFEIQAATLEHTLAGRNVVAKALTGSGKTLAFSIPIVHKLLERENRRSNRSPKAIVISPTRELCMQIYRSIQELDPRVKCVAVYGGDSINRQERELGRGVDVVCATPGRLNDHLERGNIDLNELEFLCLDEADELLTPGFKEQIENVLETSPEEKQVLLFSATMPGHIRAVARRYLNDPLNVDITANQRYKAPESVRHLCMRVSEKQQLFVIKSLIQEHKPERCIVFMETKQKTREATHALRRRMGLKADGISSDLSQSRRENIMAAFRAGVVKILVATDVAARGLDIPEVDLVIQASPPRNGTEYYIHRSGRTGRGGREGLAVMLHAGTPQDRQVIREIEKMAKMEHVTPPDHAALLVDTAKYTLAGLQRKTESRATESLVPLVQELNLTADGATRLVAAALASMAMDSDVTDNSANTSWSKPQRGSSAHRPGYKQSQGLSDWDDDDSPRYRRNNKGGKQQRGSKSSDWSRFY